LATRVIEQLRRPGLRGRLTLVLAAGATVLTLALVIGFNLVLRAGLRRDVDNSLRARASGALASVEVLSGRIRIREVPGDAAIDRQVWVFSGARVLEAPPEPAVAQAAARAAARAPGTFREVPALDLRLLGLPVRDKGRTLATVVAGVSVVPYERTAARSLAASVVLGLLVLGAMLAAIRWTIAAALRPVDRMTAEAAAWSVHDLDHRFSRAGPQDELSRLAATFNDLLARLSASFRHEQRFSAEISHELKTPLAKLIAESELALRRERTSEDYRAALAAVARDARSMVRVVETLVAVARSELDPRSGTADPAAVVESVVESLSPTTRAGVGLDLRLAGRNARLGVDGDLAERVLAPVVANALRYARTQAAVEVRSEDGVVEFVVTDDGPGVPAEQREVVFTPGFRGAPTADDVDGGHGAGLGLALARRLAVAAGGTVRCDGVAGGGTAFVITLPAA
jgi:signal transduction histidine kinase